VLRSLRRKGQLVVWGWRGNHPVAYCVDHQIAWWRFGTARIVGIVMAKALTEQRITGLAPPDGAPEIFVDGFHSVSIVNDVARLNFFSLQASSKGGKSTPTLVCRLALSLSALAAMRGQINELVEDLTNQGLIKVSSAGS